MLSGYADRVLPGGIHWRLLRVGPLRNYGYGLLPVVFDRAYGGSAHRGFSPPNPSQH
jgi:hypothetical protein